MSLGPLSIVRPNSLRGRTALVDGDLLPEESTSPTVQPVAKGKGMQGLEVHVKVRKFVI